MGRIQKKGTALNANVRQASSPAARGRAALAALALGAITANAQQAVQRPMVPRAAPARAAPAAPAWPKSWTLNEREQEGSVLIITQPGPVVVDVQASGAPVRVTLYNDAAQPAAQTAGLGALHLGYQVTAADVQRSPLWRLNITLAEPRGAASGTVVVQQPSPDPQAVSATLSAMQTRRIQAMQAQGKAQPNPLVEAAVQARRAQFEQQDTARRTALFAAIQPRLLPGLVRLPPPPSTAAPVSTPGVTTRALPPQGGVSSQIAKIPRMPRPPAITSITNAQGGADGRPGDPIVITGSGFGTGTEGYGGLIEFSLVNPPAGVWRGPYTPQALGWSDTQILTSIPNQITGIAGATQVSIKIYRGDRTATATGEGLTFQPAMDVVWMPVPPKPADSSVHFPDSYFAPGTQAGALPTDTGVPDGWNLGYAGNTPPWHVTTGLTGWFGDKGYDEFYMTETLIPQFSVYSSDVIVLDVWVCGLLGGCIKLQGADPQAAEHAWAYLYETSGPTRPRIKVRTWQNGMTAIDYTIALSLIGPRGVNPFQ